MKFKKNPEHIEAEQWWPDKPVRGVEPHPRWTGYGMLSAIDGGHAVSPGDWIVTNPNGRKYPLDPVIFEMNYVPAEPEAKKTTTTQDLTYTLTINLTAKERAILLDALGVAEQQYRYMLRGNMDNDRCADQIRELYGRLTDAIKLPEGWG